jgi:hypothetical protein
MDRRIHRDSQRSEVTHLRDIHRVVVSSLECSRRLRRSSSLVSPSLGIASAAAERTGAKDVFVGRRRSSVDDRVSSNNKQRRGPASASYHQRRS